MRPIRRLLRWLIGLIPERYSGGNLDRFEPAEQQDIMANRFRSGQ